MITAVSCRFWLFLEVFFRPDLVELLPSLFGPQDHKDQRKADQLPLRNIHSQYKKKCNANEQTFEKDACYHIDKSARHFYLSCLSAYLSLNKVFSFYRKSCAWPINPVCTTRCIRHIQDRRFVYLWKYPEYDNFCIFLLLFSS